MILNLCEENMDEGITFISQLVEVHTSRTMCGLSFGWLDSKVPLIGSLTSVKRQTVVEAETGGRTIRMLAEKSSRVRIELVSGSWSLVDHYNI